MSATLPFPTRYLAAIGVTLLAALAFLVARPLLVGDDTENAAPATPAPAVTTPATPATPAKPKVQLLAGLPRPVAAKLRASNVAVVSLYAGTTASDRAAVRDAKSGARASGAAFAAINVLDETSARELQSFVGTVGTPTVLVVRRPGKIVTQLDGRVDSALVEQAAYNAGARR
jgi:hypothetical protein